MSRIDGRSVVVIGAGSVVDGAGSLADADAAVASLCAAGIAPVELTIDPLGSGWDAPLLPGHHRSGNGPIEALADAVELISGGRADAVVISAEDPLRTGYSRGERHRLMDVFPEKSIPDAYTELAWAFIEAHGWGNDDFLVATKALYANHLRVWKSLGHENEPDAKWLAAVTPLYRGVDCANPVVDYAGRFVVASKEAVRRAGLGGGRTVRVEGVGLGFASGDGLEHIDELAKYAHLARAGEALEGEVGLRLRDLIISGDALLETYTCYPVVPLAFLVASRIARTGAEAIAFVKDRPMTITGGMNLARAPWSAPALRALIAMTGELRAGKAKHGIVHGNGGLGARQGVALLTAS